VVGWWQRRRWHRLRPWAWAAAIAVGAAGLWRVETTAHEAQATTARLAEVIDDMETERHTRCLDIRTGIHRAIVRVITDLGTPTPDELSELRAVLDDELPTGEC
jgi:hypothetical protein